MQRGFATLEVIFAVTIIAVLMTCAVPNAVRMIDRAALDYETKRLYSDLRYLQTLNRIERVSAVATGRNFAPTTFPMMKISRGNKTWQLMRGDVALREIHQMQNITKIEFTGNVSEEIRFNDAGKAITAAEKALYGTIILTSHFGKPSTIVFDNVGRIRGGRGNE